MDLYLIRHADAAPQGEGGSAHDASRPLTEEGRRQAAALGEAFARLQIKLDRLLTSPLLRARQTAEVLLQHAPAPEHGLRECDELSPGSKRRKLTAALRSLGGDRVGIVGHNPDLSVYASWLIGSRKAQVELAKAAVARIEFEGRLSKGAGTLTWLVAPAWFMG